MNDVGAADALIVRNIGLIEQAYVRALEISQKLNEACFNAVKKHLDGRPWIVEEDNESAPMFAPRSWCDPDHPDSTGSNYFIIDEIEGHGGADETWLATLLADGPNGGSPALLFRSDDQTKPKFWKQLKAEEYEVIEKLEAKGFFMGKNYVYLPFYIDREHLAQAIQENDLDQAMQPLRDAVDRIVDALPLFQQLIDEKLATV